MSIHKAIHDYNADSIVLIRASMKGMLSVIKRMFSTREGIQERTGQAHMYIFCTSLVAGNEYVVRRTYLLAPI